MRGRRPRTGSLSTWRLVTSDYRAQYAYKCESRGRLALLLLPRLATNASMHAVLLVRIQVRCSPLTRWLWRRICLSAHSIEVAQGTAIGPGLQLPHPFGIVIGPGVTIGARVTIQHGVTLGGARTRWWPGNPVGSLVIEDDVTFAPGSCAYGSVRIGRGAVIGAMQMVTADVPPGTVLTRATAHREAPPGFGEE